KVGGALLAEALGGVPTGVGTDPLAAAAALLEPGLALFDGLLHGGVVGRPSDGPPNLVLAARGAAEDPSEEAPRGAQHPPRHAGHGGRELGDPVASAVVAEELQLVAVVGGEVLLVLDYA